MIRPRDDLRPPLGGEPEPADQDGQAGDPTTDPEGRTPVWTLDTLPPELEFFRTSEAYQVELQAFSGPLDLLLYLIQKDELDIYDIPIAKITDQYLRYLEMIKLLALDNAGDFLVMAATLLRIKARMLLPVQVDEELSEEDPRADLVRRLLEYKRFKEAAAHIQRCTEERRRFHLRSASYPFLQPENIEPPLRLELFDLLAALADVLDRVEEDAVHTVHREPYTVEEKMERIRRKLGRTETIRFHDLFADDAIKMEVVVTFIALLELVRRQLLQFLQTDVNGPIWLKRHPDAANWVAGEEPSRAEAEA